MKQFLFFLTFLFLLNGCTPSWQLVTVGALSNNLDKNLVYRDSNANVSFSFYQKNGPIAFEIENDKNTPIFIDWKNSFFMRDNKGQVPMWQDISHLNGVAETSTITVWPFDNRTDINAKIYKQERITMLPPRTNVRRNLEKWVNHQYLIHFDSQYVSRKNLHSPSQIVKTKVFTPNKTISKIRVYLFVSKTEDFKKPIQLDFEFYIAEVQEMPAKYLVGRGYGDATYPDKEHPFKQPNRFYIKKLHPNGD
jgi:hypothetical protein